MSRGETDDTAGGIHRRFALRQELPPVGRWRRWLAEDRREGRTVVLSWLAPGERRLGREEFERARRWAGEVGRLRHPYLAAVVAAQVDADGLWLAEDVRAGRPLSDPCARMPRGAALAEALVGVLEAISYLHRNGLAHGWIERAALAADGHTLRLTGAALADHARPGAERSADVIAWAKLARELLAEAGDGAPQAVVLKEAADQVGAHPPEAGRLAAEVRRAMEMTRRSPGMQVTEAGADSGATNRTAAMAKVRGFLGSFLLGLLTTALTVGAIIGVVAVGALLFLDRLPREVQVPNVVGLTEAEAIARLREDGLKVGNVRRVYRDDVDAGEVAASIPEGGMTVRQGREITLVVSLGAAKVNVPRLVGLQLSEAEAVAAKAGLTLESVGKTRSQAPLGEIVKQDPAPGMKVGRGQRVAVYISGGPDFASIEAETPDGETVRIFFRTIEIVVPVGDPLQRVVIREGYGRSLTTTYDRLHRPGDRIKFDTYGRAGKRIEVLIEGERVYQTQL